MMMMICSKAMLESRMKSCETKLEWSRNAEQVGEFPLAKVGAVAVAVAVAVATAAPSGTGKGKKKYRRVTSSRSLTFVLPSNLQIDSELSSVERDLHVTMVARSSNYSPKIPLVPIPVPILKLVPVSVPIPIPEYQFQYHRLSNELRDEIFRT
uniref:Uncharacterized protein n=1 Tax=Vespula pensylvanica TaxID=30213 RepID=A0A834JLA4_VESPE|nr:hypothetical protein H0235_017800 [Vespula pensylvanica]